MRKVLVGLVSVGLMLEMLCACGSQTEKVIPNEVNNEKSPVETEETERDVLLCFQILTEKLRRKRGRK